MIEVLRDLRRGEIRYYPLLEQLPVDVDGAKGKAPIKGALTREGGEILLRFQGKLLVDVPCDRCLKETSYLYEVEAEELLEPEEDERFDLGELVNEHFVLQRPSQVLCDAECKGLCPVCGIDRNEEECDCEQGRTDPRFDRLKDLL